MFSYYLAGLKRLFEVGKKIFLVVAVFFIVITLFMYFIGKDRPATTSNPIQKNREDIYKIINDPKLNLTKEGRLTIGIYRTIMCGIIGEACTNNPSDGDKNFSHSLFGFMSDLIVLPYANPPASGLYWAYSGLQNSGFIPKTYAAEGIGFGSLAAFMNVWLAFRDIAFIVIVLVMIAIGFMIMFRMKLNPQTVISLENALPRIIITLLLITFSYAIVGFAIDLMYLITLVGVEIIGKAMNIPNIPQVQNWVVVSNMFSSQSLGTVQTYFSGLVAIIQLLPLQIQFILGGITTFVGIFIGMRMVPWIASLISFILGDVKAAGTLSAVFAGGTIEFNIARIFAGLIALPIGFWFGIVAVFLLVAFIIILGLLLLMFRIFFTLLSALIQVILYLMLAPLLLIVEAVPGQSAFSGWLKNIIGNLITFPIVVFLLLLTTSINNVYQSSSQVFTPPLLGGINPQALGALISATLLFMIPDLAKAAKQKIIGKEGLQIPVGPGALFGGVGAVGGSAMSMAQQIYYLQLGTSALFGKTDESGKRQGGITSFFSELIKPLKKS